MRSIRSTLALASLALVASACSESPADPGVEILTRRADAPSLVLKVPDESPGPPFYSIVANGGFVPHDGVWAALPFLRNPACVPPAVDLTSIVGPAAFGCTLTVEGHEHWASGPGIDPAPRQTMYRGLGAVPIVFVRWNELAPALAGGLMLPELMALPSATAGVADMYRETDILGISGPLGAGNGMYKIQARGTLPDGRSFTLRVNEVLGELRIVDIEFGGS
jgi:hypothetical protein